jgi:hypothetical protein
VDPGRVRKARRNDQTLHVRGRKTCVISSASSATSLVTMPFNVLRGRRKRLSNSNNNRSLLRV